MDSKDSKRQSQPAIAATAFLVLYMALVLITHLWFTSGFASCWASTELLEGREALQLLSTLGRWTNHHFGSWLVVVVVGLGCRLGSRYEGGGVGIV